MIDERVPDQASMALAEAAVAVLEDDHVRALEPRSPVADPDPLDLRAALDDLPRDGVQGLRRRLDHGPRGNIPLGDPRSFVEKPRGPIIAVGREITRLSQKRTPGSLRMPGVGGSCCLN